MGKCSNFSLNFLDYLIVFGFNGPVHSKKFKFFFEFSRLFYQILDLMKSVRGQTFKFFFKGFLRYLSSFWI